MSKYRFINNCPYTFYKRLTMLCVKTELHVNFTLILFQVMKSHHRLLSKKETEPDMGFISYNNIVWMDGIRENRIKENRRSNWNRRGRTIKTWVQEAAKGMIRYKDNVNNMYRWNPHPKVQGAPGVNPGSQGLYLWSRWWIAINWESMKTKI